MPDEFQYDVLSHSAKDRAVVRTRAERLRTTATVLPVGFRLAPSRNSHLGPLAEVEG